MTEGSPSPGQYLGKRAVTVKTHSAEESADAITRGGRLVADYGSFSLYQVPAEALPTLNARGHPEQIRDAHVLHLNTGDVDTSIPRRETQRKEVSGPGKHLHLVQFVGPIKPEWRDSLLASGVRIVSYIPNNAYLVYGNTSQLRTLESWAASRLEVQWEGVYADVYKVHPDARTQGKKGNRQTGDVAEYIIQLIGDDQANALTLKLLDRLKRAPVRKEWKAAGFLNIVVQLPPDSLATIATQPDVLSIQPYFARIKADERQAQILAGNITMSQPTAPGYLAWLSSKGFSQSQFDASGFVVDISDSGIDNGTTLPGHFGLYSSSDTNLPSRIVYTRFFGTPHNDSTMQGCDGHGTLNAHILGGFNDEASSFPHADASGFHYGLGVCPFVKLGSSVVFDPSMFTFPDVTSLQSQAYNDGARISNNSWGAANNGAYDAEAQTFDALVRDAQPDGATYTNAGNQEMVIVFSAGNNGTSGQQSVNTPGTAKNVITVGAAENVRSLDFSEGGNNGPGQDGCGYNDANANSLNDIASFSSRGPCADGRSKPDLVAPGTHIAGGVAQESPAPGADSLGVALACFDSSGICALAGSGTLGSSNNFFPGGQEFYTVSSGTSHAAPAVAGAAALIRQYFLNTTSNSPSPAMTKAYLINSTRYLTGVSANDTLWSANQGMGEANLGMAFDGVARIVRDQIPEDKFTNSGEFRIVTGRITDPAKPVRITLAWTDAPGSTTGAAYNNDLDLVVQACGQTFKGNVFNGRYSVAGGAADQKNNVESVFLPTGSTGNFVVTVSAANINSDGVPNEAPDLDQDFALVIYNGEEAALPVIHPGISQVLLEGCAPTNGFVDAGETVAVNFGLQNIGASQTTNLVATLLATNGVRNPSGPQTYGAVPTNGSVYAPFIFQAAAGCGTTLRPTLHLVDGTNDYGNVEFAIRLGSPTNVLQETFDTTNCPALPSGWTAASTGSLDLWTTTTNSNNSEPNAAFAPDANAAGVADLESPPFAVNSLGARLSFMHNYSLESGYDGGVLEIKIGTNGYVDITSAGGSFETGGYDTTLLAGDGSNPLMGRNAWTGSSGGFVTTVVDLPASAAGEMVQFKWRCGTDTSNGGQGWYVDDVTVIDYECCGDFLPAQAEFSATPLVYGPPPVSVTFTDLSTGTISDRIWNFGNGIMTNTTATNFSIAYTDAGTNKVTLTVDGPAGGSTLTRTNYIIVTNLAPVIVASGVSLLAESCTNGAVDPGETVTLSFELKNVGGGAATNLTATLQTSGGVTAPSGPENYGPIGSEAEVSRPFTFNATGACGGLVLASLNLHDGSQNLGTISFQVPLGGSNAVTENFESVSAPALPAGWSTVTNGAASEWVSTNDTAFSGVLSAFASGPDGIGVSELLSPILTAPASQARLSFRHAFNLESYTPGTGLDGAVLEMAVDGGPFTDIVDAGATFVFGGYNCMIDNSTGNPLGGREGWSGDSAGFILTSIDLPPACSGHSIQFRWLLGSDESTASAGWHIDDVTLSGISCCYHPPVIIMQPQSKAVMPDDTALFSVNATGIPPLEYQWRFYGTNLPGATGTNYAVVAAQTIDAGPYDVLVSNPGGTVTSAVATLSILSQPILLFPQFNSNGLFDFILSGNAGYNYVVEVSTNLSNWSALATISNSFGETPFADTNNLSSPFRAYRARLVP